MQYQYRLGVMITFLAGLALNVGQQSISPFISMPALPDWVFLLVLFWSMRIPSVGFIVCVWFLGLLQSVMFDDIFGVHSFLYALSAFVVQNARLRLLVVSILTRWCFIGTILFIYAVALNLGWRLFEDSLQWRLLSPFILNAVGWCLVSLTLLPLYPLVIQQDLFDSEDRKV